MPEIKPPKLDEKLIAPELEEELAAARLKEKARIKTQSKGDMRKARRILLTQLEQPETNTDPRVPVVLEDGTRRYGSKDAAILFRADGRVSLIRRSASLKAEFKSIASRLGAFDKTGPYAKGLNPVVFELAFPDAGLTFPSFVTAVNEMLSQSEQNRFERKRDELVRQINAAWAIRNRVSDDHKEFLQELKRLAQERSRLARELGRPPTPPTKGELAGKLGYGNNAQRMSQLCRELGFDWLPTENPGPKPSKWKRSKPN